MDLLTLFASTGYKLADFTDAEQKCISGKLESMKGEDKPQDQKVAIAIKYCAPEKSTSKAAADFAPVTVSSMPGAKYTAVDNGDGTWNLLNVVVLCEMPKGEKGAKEDVGRPWHEQAFAKAKARETEDKYWGPVHVNHHETGVPTSPAGYLRFNRVGSFRYEGKIQSAIFCDFVRIPADVFREIDAGRLGYLSVEVTSWEMGGEIASVALMADQAPFYRLPMLTVGAKIKAAEPVKYEPSMAPMMAYASAGDGGFILLKLGAEIKLDDKPSEKKPDEPPVEKELEKKPDEGKPGAQTVTLEMVYGEVAKLVALMSKAMGVGADAEPPGQRFAPVDVPEKKEEPPPRGAPVKMNAKEEAVAEAKEIGELNAKLQILLNDKVKREKEEGVSKLAADAKTQLAGWNVSAEMDKTIRLMAEKGKDALDSFVATIKASVPKDPPSTFLSLTGGTGGSGSGDEPDWLAKYRTQGAAVYESALKAYRVRVELGDRIKVTPEKFVEGELNRLNANGKPLLAR